MNSILEYRTRSHRIVSYDSDFGKVNWEDFKTTPVNNVEPFDDTFGKVNWEEIGTLEALNQVSLNIVESISRQAVEEVEAEHLAEENAQEEWKKELYETVGKLSFTYLTVEETKQLTKSTYLRININDKPTPFVVKNYGKYMIVGYTAKLLCDYFTKEALHLEEMDLYMFELFGYVEALLKKFPKQLSISDLYYDDE